MFCDMDVPGDALALAHELRAAVRRIAKIPTCVGLGPTKTIAKLANALAKDEPGLGGVCDLRDERDRTRRYQRLPVGEVWGIGRRTTDKLAALGIDTVARFLAMPRRDARALLTVVGARVQAELRGVSCLPLGLVAASRKGIAVTRSFGRPVTVWPDMREAVAHHAARAGEKLRAEGLVAGRMTVFLHTNPHSGDPWHSAQHGGRIEPTADTGALIGEAVRMLRPLWRDGHRYSKVGVVLDDLRDEEAQPRGLFPTRDPVKSTRLMAALDAVNARHGRGTLRPLATGLARPWGTRHARLSHRYTTRVDELMEAEAW
jgi:DNA polymerase V